MTMTKSYRVTDEFSEETMDKFLGEFDGGGTIYLDSSGGWVLFANMLLDIIRRHRDSVEIVAPYRLASAAASLYLMAPCRKRLLPSFTYAGLHIAGFTLHSRSLRATTPSSPDNIEFAAEQEDFERWMTWFSALGIDDAGLKQLGEGNAYFVNRSDFQKMADKDIFTDDDYI